MAILTCHKHLHCNSIRDMSTRFVVVDRTTPMLLPPSLQDWLQEGHLAHFVVETVALLSLNGFQVNTRGTGNAQFPPSMMLSLLIYNYAAGRMSSRQIEKATYDDVASRYICGGDAHPDHDTICAFRRQNAKLVFYSFQIRLNALQRVTCGPRIFGTTFPTPKTPIYSI